MDKFSIIVPIFNEEPVIHELYNRLSSVMKKIDGHYELIFINDGSKDKSREFIKEIAKKDITVKLIEFSRNFGHQIAVTAGIDYAKGDAVIIIDADLQDPPEVIPEMIRLWRQGYQVVYGKRIKRRGETVFKKITAKLFYKFLLLMTNIDIPADTGDFRLIDRVVCEAIKQFKEKNRFLRGMVSWVGFKQTAVEFMRDERFAGSTKYPLKKMIKFAADGITSFSYKPLKIATSIGFMTSILSFIYLCVVLFLKIFTLYAILGWASIIAVNLFFNGIILMIIGLLGEYVGRIYDEIKGRPLYLVSEVIGWDEELKE